MTSFSTEEVRKLLKAIDDRLVENNHQLRREVTAKIQAPPNGGRLPQWLTAILLSVCMTGGGFAINRTITLLDTISQNISDLTTEVRVNAADIQNLKEKG